MLQKTKGIALHYYNYSESSVIAKIFTYDAGLQSFMINGIRQKKAKTILHENIDVLLVNERAELLQLQCNVPLQLI